MGSRCCFRDWRVLVCREEDGKVNRPVKLQALAVKVFPTKMFPTRVFSMTDDPERLPPLLDATRHRVVAIFLTVIDSGVGTFRRRARRRRCRWRTC